MYRIIPSVCHVARWDGWLIDFSVQLVHFSSLSLSLSLSYRLLPPCRLLSADVAVAAPLISMGALLGKTTYMQLIFMGIVELVVYTGNKYIGEHYFMVSTAKLLLFFASS